MDVCKRSKIEYKSLAQGIDELKQEGMMEKHYEQLMDVAKFYRVHASHPSSEVFTKDKARLFLSSLVIFCSEIFR